jgi:nucleoside-triphosphatase
MFRPFFARLWQHIDALAGLVVALLFSVAGILGMASLPVLVSATLITLAIIALAVIRDRVARERASSNVRDLLTRVQDPSPDYFFHKETSETPLLRAAEHEAWLVQETGSLITERNQGDLVKLLLRGGTVRFLLTAPTEFAARLVAFRNASLNHDTILSRHRQCRGQLEAIMSRVGDSAENLQVRYTPFPVDATSVIVDPCALVRARQLGLVRFTGFGIPYPQKPDFNIRGDSSPHILNHYYQEAQTLFHNASKVVLLTGPPRSGKTTLLERLVETFERNPELFYVITREVGPSGDRTGFEVFTSVQRQPRRFAAKTGNGEYEVYDAELASVTEQIRTAYYDRKVILLDEIGPLQARNQQFTKIVSLLLDDPRATLFASVAAEPKHPFISMVRRHYRSTVIRIGADESGQIHDQLIQELGASLRLTHALPRDMWGDVQ